MIEAAQERPGQYVARLLQSRDFIVEHGEPRSADGLPFGDIRGMKNACDVVEGETGILEHADEDEPAERLLAIAPLPGGPGVGL